MSPEDKRNDRADALRRRLDELDQERQAMLAELGRLSKEERQHPHPAEDTTSAATSAVTAASSSDVKIALFRSLFRGREDVFPRRWAAEARAIAFVTSSGGWGHNYYENDYVKEDGVWKFAALHGPFNMYSGYDIGWLDNTTLNTFPEKFPPPPDLPPTVIYLTYPNYYVEPFHYPNPVTGEPMPAPDPAAGGAAFGSYKP